MLLSGSHQHIIHFFQSHISAITIGAGNGRSVRADARHGAASVRRHLQVVKRREGGRVVEVKVKAIYGDETTLDPVGAHTSYVERTNLTSRHMYWRLARKTLSFSKELEMLKASSVWEDAVYNPTREVKTLRVEVEEEERRFEPRTPAMAAGLTDHIRNIKELLWTVVSPIQSTQDG